MRILNSLGQIVKQETFIDKEYQIIDIGCLKAGVYHIEINNKNKYWQQPLFILK